MTPWAAQETQADLRCAAAGALAGLAVIALSQGIILLLHWMAG